MEPPVIRFTVDTPLPSGRMRVAATAHGVIWAAFHENDTEQMPEGLDLADPAAVDADRRARAVTQRLAAYFAGQWRKPSFELPIDWSLTSNLQRKVLHYLDATVPFGATITYGALAERCAGFDPEMARSGQAARLVGTIMATTPIAILIPAHRVVAADGLGGFGSGPDALPTKRWLLTLEGCIPPTLDWDGPEV
ncbi:methylated-DNA--[protein]-cysteine S-methyltransferase [Actinospica sp. MGRD01-02]|uniref:Methylated-DNA--protein-cysteine methyltransferase n=1 Tax=Actinospica acidithermotolerans TaxID=2828514 RepID=A0A941IIH2_9ACTN|nr:methylated-DNA--[protein]-cysteine S-methyltransferase [Actinospica acidithermotolerans]MBR7824756.1 methylated-DNA--[protein]-cysteine S-methyltransferase [Actinospica acidithermotolerans]